MRPLSCPLISPLAAESALHRHSSVAGCLLVAVKTMYFGLASGLVLNTALINLSTVALLLVAVDGKRLTPSSPSSASAAEHCCCSSINASYMTTCQFTDIPFALTK